MKSLITLFLVFIVAFNAYGVELNKGKLSNGLPYITVKTSNMPIISLVIKVKAGSFFDETNRFGQAKLVAASLESCDTRHLSSEKLRELFDKYGIDSYVSVSKGYITISATTLRDNMNKMFYLISEILKTRFDKKNFSIVKRETIDAYKSLQNNKDYLAIHSAFVNLIAQPEYSHSSIGTLNGLKGTTNRDAKRFFEKYFRANNMVLVLSGDVFGDLKLKKELSRWFSFIKPMDNKARFDEPVFRYGLHVSDIIKPQTRQSYIYFTFPSFDYPSKNFYAAEILAYILGGKLNAFITKDIRTKHGYAYSVFAFNYKLPKKSVFVIGLQTQNEFTLNAINRVLEDIKSYDKYISEDRLKMAKEYLIGSRLIGLQTPQSVASQIAQGYMLGVEEPIWVFDKKNIEKVSLQDLKFVARRLFSDTVSIGIVSSKNIRKDVLKLAKKYGYR
ncbi:M16 family metallopeptidase [Hippea maritima]|uniref:Peptidase M16 domain protein n=1 Tax=Hippea maritima (strain ATCC 700847 / DSM 10411 / MH2) TaxID=760142 RepID=F2LVF3_HIPMA|nr:pitrilysin family protein [Hippea maritima]AEA33737.1 peptidase M16 domain protein [Hippea maritima DSM 10411]